MQAAGPGTVLGDFNDSSFSYQGIRARFFRKNGRYFVNTDGPDGALKDYPIAFTFGLTPLQQYLIDLPDGRKQALSIAWDSRDKAQGGQHWFHLYPQEKIVHTDPLHWTGPYQNWNYMCADCHSTQVRHNYDAQADRFDTQWGEVNVACEACHGPGSQHREWARRQSYWLNGLKPKQADKGLVVDLSSRNQRDPNRFRTGLSFQESQEVKTCAACHARRTALTNEYKPAEGFDQHFLPALLRPELYELDGQIKDEVYEYNSFRQSKMFAKGVSCSDCHEPHALKLRGDVQSVCLQCHQASQYDAPTHHHHGQAGSVRCVDCHMPTKNYMVVDPRRDHSFRVPRPDQTVRLGVPNACQSCHQDKNAKWAETSVQNWLGRDARGFQNFVEAFQKIRSTDVGAEAALQTALRDPTTPPLVKGSLLAESSGFVPDIPDEIQTSLKSPSVEERLGALNAIVGLPFEQRWALARHLLHAPERNVRIEAARVLIDPAMDENLTQQIAPALAELQEAGRIYASRPQWRMTAAELALKQGHPQKAIAEYQAALKIQPTLAQAYVNLADIYRGMGDEMSVSEILERGQKILPNEAALHYAKGLHWIRLKYRQEGIAELKLATELAPEDRNFAYAYAVGLFSQGDKNACHAFLERRLQKNPADRSALYLLAQISIQDNRPDLLQPYLARLNQLAAKDRQAQQLFELLQIK